MCDTLPRVASVGDGHGDDSRFHSTSDIGSLSDRGSYTVARVDSVLFRTLVKSDACTDSRFLASCCGVVFRVVGCLANISSEAVSRLLRVEDIWGREVFIKGEIDFRSAKMLML